MRSRFWLYGAVLLIAVVPVLMYGLSSGSTVVLPPTTATLKPSSTPTSTVLALDQALQTALAAPDLCAPLRRQIEALAARLKGQPCSEEPPPAAVGMANPLTTSSTTGSVVASKGWLSNIMGSAQSESESETLSSTHGWFCPPAARDDSFWHSLWSNFSFVWPPAVGRDRFMLLQDWEQWQLVWDPRWWCDKLNADLRPLGPPAVGGSGNQNLSFLQN